VKCEPCAAGLFSPGVNAACQRCPGGAASQKAANGLTECFCSEGSFIPTWAYTGADPGSTSPPLQCAGCGEICDRDSTECAKCSPWSSVGPTRNPLAIRDFWSPVSAANWTAETKIYSCPHSRSCLGDSDSGKTTPQAMRKYSIKYKTDGDIWRESDDVSWRVANPNYVDCSDPSIPTKCCPTATKGATPDSTACSWGPPRLREWGGLKPGELDNSSPYGYSGTKCRESDGYSGIACAVCLPNEGGNSYAFTGAGCIKCADFPKSNAPGAIVSFVLLLLLFIVDLIGRIAHCRTKAMAKDSKTLSLLMKKKKILMRTNICVCQVMQMVGFAQQLCTLNMNLKVEFPEEFITLSDSVSFLNFEIITIINQVFCLKGGYYSMLQILFWFQTLSVIVVLADYLRSRKYSEEEDAGIFHVKFLVMFFFTLYPMSCKTFLSFLLCQKIEGKHYLMADYREHCYDDKWASFATIAIPGILVYVIGTPAFFLGMLWYLKSTGLLSTPANEDKFAFLFINFKPDFWYFEIYSMLVKCVMCGIVMFIDRGSATQVATTLFITIVVCFVALTTAPYKNTDLNANAVLTTTTMVMTLFVALLLKTRIYQVDGWDQGVLNGFVMAVNFITLFLFTYRFIRVQGNFLCENYCPKQCQECFLAFNRLMGWKPVPTEPPPSMDDGKDEEEDNLVVYAGGGKKANDYWHQTFKVVS